MDCPDKIPPSGTPAHHRSNTTNRHDRSSSRHHSHTRCSHHDCNDRPRFSHSQSHSHYNGYRSTSHHDSLEAAPGHPTDLHDIVSHTTEAQAHTTTAMTCHTADLHPIEIFPEITTDLNTNPENYITSQHKDLLQAHKQHHGNIKTEDTNRSQLMIHHPNTTAQMIKIVTPRMI